MEKKDKSFALRINTQMLEQIDKYAKALNISRSSAVCVLLSKQLQREKDEINI